MYASDGAHALARAAARTLVVVYNRKVVYESNCSLGTVLYAFAAGNTAVGAVFTHVSAFLSAVTLDYDTLGVLYQMNKSVGAGVNADAASYTMLREQLLEVLHTLTPREENVLKLRFGLEDGRPRTLEEVGKAFDITRERIRQIEAKALRKLRHPSRSKKLRDYLE